MVNPLNLTKGSERLQPSLNRSEALLQWEQLPAERQRELVRLLAALVLKRLSPQVQSREGGSDE